MLNFKHILRLYDSVYPEADKKFSLQFLGFILLKIHFDKFHQMAFLRKFSVSELAASLAVGSSQEFYLLGIKIDEI